MYNFAKCALGTKPYFCSVHSLHYIGWFLVGDRLCLLVWYMGDIYSFMHKSTSYQSFCMTDQAAPPQLYFCAQYLAGQYFVAEYFGVCNEQAQSFLGKHYSYGLSSTRRIDLGIISLTPLHHIVNRFSFSFSTYVEYSKIYCSARP